MGRMISISVSGDFRKTDKFLAYLRTGKMYNSLERYARAGVNALASATPIGPTGVASSSWDYEIKNSGGDWSIFWTNSDIEGGFNVIIGLQYGHGTGTGGWVAGQDFINPAIKPIMDEISNQVWKAVKSA